MANKLKANTSDITDTKSEASPKYLVSLLAVEDNLVNQMVIKKTLERLGYQVMVANNGEQGVEMLLAHDFQGVLMDVQMPVMDGITATKKLRLEHGITVPIIALTANAQEAVEQACMDAGMDMFLTKPISREKLEAALNKVLKINR
ncbi:MAG: CheY-like chemotaxis protein [Psychrobacter glaciei]|jgi:CheY-like chemotaxis protein